MISRIAFIKWEQIVRAIAISIKNDYTNVMKFIKITWKQCIKNLFCERIRGKHRLTKPV